jgi:fructose-1-phosphate kinase PfkB-like protein
MSIVPNAYTAHPNFTVAAGDTFNAGICLGIIAKCSSVEMLLIASSLTSYFIRSGKRGSALDIIQFLQHYQDYLIKDNPSII